MMRFATTLLCLFCFTVTARAWSLPRILKTGAREVEHKEFREHLDRELPGAVKRLAKRLYSENKLLVNGIIIALFGGSGAGLERARRKWVAVYKEARRRNGA